MSLSHKVSCFLVTLDVKLLSHSLWYRGVTTMLIKLKSKILPYVLFLPQVLKSDGRKMVLVMFMTSPLSQDIPSDPAIPRTSLFVVAYKENYPPIQILVIFQTLSKQKGDVVHGLEI